MRRRKCLLCAWLCFSASALAQVGTANIAGMVEDSTNARVVGASVKLINTQTGTENDSVTNQYGIFLLPDALPGNYTLQIAKAGFATAEFTGIALNIGDSKQFLIRMEISGLSQTVTVNAAGMTLNTTDGSIGTVVDHGLIQNLPLNGRSFQGLIEMTPGTVSQSPQAISAGDFSINGQRPESNAFLVDGVSADVGTGIPFGPHKVPGSGDEAATTALGTTQGIVPLDALQEFRVLSSSYSAEYGRTLGSQFTLLTRSGTDRFHGSVYDYLRNDIFDAADWFEMFNIAGAGAPFHQEDFGGTLGGPVEIPGLYHGQDKTFFFATHETLIVFQPTAPLVQYVPDSLLHEGVPAALKPVIASFPFPEQAVTGPVEPTGLAPFILNSLSLPASLGSTSLRLDHAFSPKISAFFRFGDTPSDAQSRDLSFLSQIHMRTRVFTLGSTAQLSPTTSNGFGFGYAETKSNLNATFNLDFNAGFNGPVSVNLGQDMGVPPSYGSSRAEVYIRIPDIGESYIDADNGESSLHQWNLRDTYSLQAGHHLFRLGIDQRHIVSEIVPPAVSVEADYFSRAAMLNNLADNVTVTKNEPATPVFNEFAAFAQDDWHVSKVLSLSLGLRWEIDPPPGEAHGKNAYTLLGSVEVPSTLRPASRGTPLWHTSWSNFAPRLGVAWIINNQPGQELVFRTGGGVFYGTDNRAAVNAFNGAGFSATAYSTNTPIPIPASQFDFSVNPSGPFNNTLAFAFPSHFQLPYTLQWNTSLEKAFGSNQTLTASYVGVSGHRLLHERILDIGSENPDLGDVGYFPGGLASNYQALQLRFQRSITPGLQMLTSYAWSHTLDYGSTDPRYPLTYGTSDFDVRHNLQAAFTWDTRRLSGGWIRGGVLSGWGADGRMFARTAFPVTPLGNLVSDPITGDHYYSGVDLMPGKPLYIYSSQYPGGRMLNGGPDATNPAFQLPRKATAGNAPRNTLRGFGDFQVNFAIRKNFHIYDRFGVQFRAETFNLFNHPDLGYVDPHLTDQLFGQSTLMLNQSFGSTGPLYQQGGPRSLQFFAKITF